jgi:hypothetical protein
MKTVSISLVAAWAATLRWFQDGDVFRESQLDLMMGDVADRLGTLKTLVDGKATLAANNSWSGNQTFDGDVSCTGGFAATTVDCSGISCTGGTSFPNDPVAGVERRILLGSDAPMNITAAYDQVRIPVLSANRVYTLKHTGVNAPREGAKIEIVRNGNGDAFTLTVKREDATTIGIFIASTAAHATYTFHGGKWLVDVVAASVTTFANTD